jgi:hypothetical protein
MPAIHLAHVGEAGGAGAPFEAGHAGAHDADAARQRFALRQVEAIGDFDDLGRMRHQVAFRRERVATQQRCEVARERGRVFGGCDHAREAVMELLFHVTRERLFILDGVRDAAQQVRVGDHRAQARIELRDRQGEGARYRGENALLIGFGVLPRRVGGSWGGHPAGLLRRGAGRRFDPTHCA